MAPASRKSRRKTHRKNHRKVKRSRRHRGGAASGWFRKVSRTTGKDYWVNKQTGVSSWTIPGEVKHCNSRLLTKEDQDYCLSHPSAVANVGGGERNIQFRIRKERAKTGDGCTLKYKVNSSGSGEMVPVCDGDTPLGSGTPRATNVAVGEPGTPTSTNV